jgi:hypothetical protein
LYKFDTYNVNVNFMSEELEDLSLEEREAFKKMDELNNKLCTISDAEFAFMCCYFRFKREKMTLLAIAVFFNEAKELVLLMREEGIVLSLTDERLGQLKELIHQKGLDVFSKEFNDYLRKENDKDKKI